jgi:hypothetical protein
MKTVAEWATYYQALKKIRLTRTEWERILREWQDANA